MRYFITICAVLALTVNLGNADVSGNAHSLANSRELHKDGVGRGASAGHSGILVIADLQRRAADLARGAAHSTAWIGDRANVVLNRSWLVENDLASHIQLVKSLDLKQPSADSGSLAPLAEWVRLAKGTFRPITDADLTAAQADLKAKVDRLGWMLSGSSADVQSAVGGWKGAIHWDELQAEIGRGKDARPDELRRLTQFVHDAQGSDTLDHSDDPTAKQGNLDFRSALQEVRVALHRYRLLLVAAGPNGAAQFDDRVESIAKSLTGDPASWTSTESNNLGELLGELQAEGQTPALVAAVQEWFDHPNLFIRAPQEFVAKLSEQDPVDETNKDFKDVILGTNIFGTTHIRGQKTVTLIPNDQQAVMGVTFSGNVESRTVGYHPPVTITSHGTTQLSGMVRVTIDGDGYSSSQACSNACMHTCIDCIAICGGRLVQRIATKKVYQGKPEAECVAAQHAEQKLNERMESDAKEALGASNNNYKLKMRDPLMSWGAFPRSIRYATTTSDLTIRAVEANEFQLGAPATVERPTVDGNPFLAVRLHESFVNNLLASSLGGRTVSQAQFEDGVGNLLGPDAAAKTRKTGETPQQIKEREAKMTDVQREDYEKDLKFKRANRKITFVEENPITVEFTDHGFSITIRGTRFEGEDLDKPAGAENITARYKFVEGPNGPERATRIGELDVAPPAWRKLSPLQRTTLKTAEVDKLRGRFNDLLPPTIEFQGLDFSQSAQPWNKIGSLQTTHVAAGNGWLSIDWKQGAQ